MKEAEITVPEHGLGKLKERGKGAGGRAALNARLREELEGLSLRPGAPAMTRLTEELERISFESDVCTALPAEAIDLEPVRWPLNARPLPADRAFELHAQKASRDHESILAQHASILAQHTSIFAQHASQLGSLWDEVGVMGGAGQNSFAKTMRVSLAAAGSAVYIDTKLQMEVVRAAESLQGSPFSGVTGHPSIPAWVQSSLGAGAGGALNKYARQLDRLASETGGYVMFGGAGPNPLAKCGLSFGATGAIWAGSSEIGASLAPLIAPEAAVGGSNPAASILSAIAAEHARHVRHVVTFSDAGALGALFQEIGEQARRWLDNRLVSLETDYACDGNPAHALEAFRWVLVYKMLLPDWLRTYLLDAIAEIYGTEAGLRQGEPIEREAQLVGKAFGFGQAGPGQSSNFTKAFMLDRDRQIHDAVGELLEDGTKLDIAYSEVANSFNISRSTVQRAYARIARSEG